MILNMCNHQRLYLDNAHLYIILENKTEFRISIIKNILFHVKTEILKKNFAPGNFEVVNKIILNFVQ